MTVVQALETGSGPIPIEVTLVTSRGCHFCARAHQIMEAVGTEFAIALDVIDMDTPDGQTFQARWRAPFPPLVIIDGELFGYGRISERKLIKHLASRATGRGA